MPSVSNVRCKFHGTPIPLRRGQGRPAKGADGMRLLGECPDCEAEIDAIGVSAGELSKIDTDEVHHGHDSLMSPLSFGDLLDTIYRERGYDEYVERQVSYIATRGREMREPAPYESAFLPTTNARYAMLSALAKRREFDHQHFVKDYDDCCVNGHSARTHMRTTIAGNRYCTGCSSESSMRRSRRIRGTPQDRAWRITHEAIRSGKLVRQPCEVCGITTPTVHAHHDDYLRPLDVRWLCLIHHIRQHHNLFTKIRRIKASVARKAKWLQRSATP